MGSSPKHLLVVGYTSAKAFETSSIDWWLVDTNSGDAVRTGVYEALVRAGVRTGGQSRTPVPYGVTPTDKTAPSTRAR